MGRMHTRKKGKSGSKKPSSHKAPRWLSVKESEVENLIAELAKKGEPPSKIGMILRDNHGIPDVKIITKKTMVQILKKHSLSPHIPEDLKALLTKALATRRHLEENKKDDVAKRNIVRIESKIRRLSNYYLSKQKLPDNWSYNRKQIEMLIK